MKLAKEIFVSRSQRFFDGREQLVHRAVEAIESVEGLLRAAPQVVLVEKVALLGGEGEELCREMAILFYLRGIEECFGAVARFANATQRVSHIV